MWSIAWGCQMIRSGGVQIGLIPTGELWLVATSTVQYHHSQGQEVSCLSFNFQRHFIVYNLLSSFKTHWFLHSCDLGWVQKKQHMMNSKSLSPVNLPVHHLSSAPKITGKGVSLICGITASFVSLNNLHTSSNFNHTLHLHHNITISQGAKSHYSITVNGFN